MDINTLRIAMTLLGLATFAAIVLWAYLPSRSQVQSERARHILEDRDL
jgi:hypothetical protein